VEQGRDTTEKGKSSQWGVVVTLLLSRSNHFMQRPGLYAKVGPSRPTLAKLTWTPLSVAVEVPASCDL